MHGRCAQIFGSSVDHTYPSQVHMTSHVLFTPVKCNNGGKRTLVSAISHTSCHEPAKTSNEKRKDPFANVGTPPKKGKVEPTFTLAPCIDGPWNCVFVDEEIIPLWPQYVHKDNIKRHYIRIDKRERWVTDYTVVLKRPVLRDAAPQNRCCERQFTPQKYGQDSVC